MVENEKVKNGGGKCGETWEKNCGNMTEKWRKDGWKMGEKKVKNEEKGKMVKNQKGKNENM